MTEGRGVPSPVTALVGAIRMAIPGVIVTLDAPHAAAGQWWVDCRLGDAHDAASWQAGIGYGVFDADASFGSRPTRIVQDVPGVVGALFDGVAVTNR